MKIYSDDTFITSYPKSGNTWVRFFLANLLRGDDRTDFTNLDLIVPDVAKIDAGVVDGIPRPRFLKSHQPFTSHYPRVLYLVRDVRAVVPSYYRQRLRMGVIPPRLSMTEFVRMFIDGVGAQFGPWDSHVLSWMENQSDPTRFRLIRYEDIIRRPGEAFRDIVAFLGVEANSAAVESAIELSSFQRMRQLEQQAGRNWPEKRHATDLSIPFMFAGQSGTWRGELDSASLRMLEDRFGGTLRKLGYPL